MSHSQLHTLYLLVGLITVCHSPVQIISSPQTVRNATLGSTVRFECRISDAIVLPEWSINGRDYQITDLPLGYDFESVSNSNVLIVSSVEISMNNSVYYCFFFTYSSEEQKYIPINSSRAMLIIQPPNSSRNSMNTATRHMESTFQNAVSPTVISTTSFFSSSQKIMASTTVRDSSGELYTMYYNSSSSFPTATIVYFHNVTNASRMSQYSLHIAVGITVAAVAFASLAIITSVVWIYCHIKRKGDKAKSNKKCTQCPVYDEISAVTAGPPVHPNPAYEKPTKFKLEPNPAYETVNK